MVKVATDHKSTIKGAVRVSITVRDLVVSTINAVKVIPFVKDMHIDFVEVITLRRQFVIVVVDYIDSLS